MTTVERRSHSHLAIKQPTSVCFICLFGTFSTLVLFGSVAAFVPGKQRCGRSRHPPSLTVTGWVARPVVGRQSLHSGVGLADTATGCLPTESPNKPSAENPAPNHVGLLDV